MKNRNYLFRYINVVALISVLLISPIMAQTRIAAPKNPYSPTKDVELGRQAAAEVEKKMPVIQDRQIQNYIEKVGRRLVDAMPAEYQHSEFEYSFKVVNVKDINAFALPGGFTYVNSGLINVAHNEGELAGVMAHEISHVALRHGTAQAAKAQKYALGATAGAILGAIIGGGIGGVVSQGSQLGVGAYFLRFSREYERQADTLGAQIMARAGYDPNDLANMFRTIEQQAGGKSGPEWLSDHPNPGNRYEAISREAQSLQVRNPIRETQDFTRTQARLRETGGARTSEEVARGNRRYGNGNRRNTDRDQRYPDDNRNGNNQRYPDDDRYPDEDRYPDSNRRVSNRIDIPSTKYRTFQDNFIQVDIPQNWRDLSSDNTITFAPEGAYGEAQGRFVFTHGVMMGTLRSRSRNLRSATEELINSFQEGNPNLRAQGSYQRSSISGRDGLAISFTNISDITGKTEVVNIYTTLLRNGDLFYMIPVVPQAEYRNYQRAFQNVVRSIQLSD